MAGCISQRDLRDLSKRISAYMYNSKAILNAELMWRIAQENLLLRNTPKRPLFTFHFHLLAGAPWLKAFQGIFLQLFSALSY
jgi:hypothetical protein